MNFILDVSVHLMTLTGWILLSLHFYPFVKQELDINENNICESNRWQMQYNEELN